MSAALFVKELLVFLRNRTALALGAALIVFVFAAAALGAQRSERIAFERAAAEAADREAWVSQGVRNPHAAAHFSRYAFKSFSALAAFDPGVADYAGLAVWMEAHQQSPAVFRRAEDLGASHRLASINSAWILQVLVPLLVFVALHASIAGEREDGTLRQLSATGVSASTLVVGKLSAAVAALALLLAPALVGAVLIAAPRAASLGEPADVKLRIALLSCAYLVYIFIQAFLALGVSALFRQRRSAFLALLAVWAVSVVLIPRAGGDLALRLHPEPGVETFRTQLADAGDTLWSDPQFQTRERDEVLARYGVARVEDLPFNYVGLTLQRSEERAHPRFEAFYTSLGRIHDAQEKVLAQTSLLSPSMALAQLSSGLAATDRSHHEAFVHAAEAHRRVIMRQLNNDIQNNAGDDGYGYAADESLWRATAQFEYEPPSFVSMQRHYWTSALVLLGQLAVALVFAGFAVAHARLRSALQ